MSAPYGAGLFIPEYSGARPISADKRQRSLSTPRQRAGAPAANSGYAGNQVYDAQASSQPRSAQRNGSPSIDTSQNSYMRDPNGSLPGASSSRLTGLTGASQTHLYARSPGLAAAAAVYTSSSRPQSAGSLAGGSPQRWKLPQPQRPSETEQAASSGSPHRSPAQQSHAAGQRQQQAWGGDEGGGSTGIPSPYMSSGSSTRAGANGSLGVAVGKQQHGQAQVQSLTGRGGQDGKEVSSAGRDPTHPTTHGQGQLGNYPLWQGQSGQGQKWQGASPAARPATSAGPNTHTGGPLLSPMQGGGGATSAMQMHRTGPVMATAGVLGPGGAALMQQQQQHARAGAGAAPAQPLFVGIHMPAQVAGTYVSYSSAGAGSGVGHGARGEPAPMHTSSSSPTPGGNQGAGWAHRQPLMVTPLHVQEATGRPSSASSGDRDRPTSVGTIPGMSAPLSRPGSAGTGAGGGKSGSVGSTDDRTGAHAHGPPVTPIAAGRQAGYTDRYAAIPAMLVHQGSDEEQDGDDVMPLNTGGGGRGGGTDTGGEDGSSSPNPYEAAVTPGHGRGGGGRPSSASAFGRGGGDGSNLMFASPGVASPQSGAAQMSLPPNLAALNMPTPVMPDFSHLPPEEAEVARKAWQRQVQREREWVARQRLKHIVAHPEFDGRATTDFYGFGKVLGQGSFGEVRLAWHRLAGAKVAIKSYEKAKLTEPNHWKRVQQEIRLMERLNHPNVIRECEMIDSPKRIHIVMEYAGGGNLCSYVKAKQRLGEQEARKHFLQLLCAVEYMHDLGIIHRDIKLENVLFDEEQANVKLTDFGFSVQVRDPNKRLKIFCGTPSYMAPEITQRKEYLGRPVDVWSLAVLLYAMLAGHFPFTAKTYPELYKKIAAAQLKFPDHMSSAVRDLLRRMLHPDPVKRLSLAHARMHPWVAPSLAVAAPPPSSSAPGDKSLLISDEPSRDVNEAVLQRCEHLGFKRKAVMESILGRAKNAAATAYYLVLARMGRSARVGPAPSGQSQGAGPPAAALATASQQRPSTAGAVQTRAAASAAQSAAHVRAVTSAQMSAQTQVGGPPYGQGQGRPSSRSGSGKLDDDRSQASTPRELGRGQSAPRGTHGAGTSSGISVNVAGGGMTYNDDGTPRPSMGSGGGATSGSAFGRVGRGVGAGQDGGGESITLSNEGKTGDGGRAQVPTQRARSAGPATAAAARPRSAAQLGRAGAGEVVASFGAVNGTGPSTFVGYGGWPAFAGASGAAPAGGGGVVTGVSALPLQGALPLASVPVGGSLVRPVIGATATPTVGDMGSPMGAHMTGQARLAGPVKATAAALPQGML